jgi:hypothetical protein
MPGTAKIALDALNEAIIEVGVPPPASLGLPMSITKVVTVDQWRQYAYRMGISQGGERAQQKAFAEGSLWLQGDSGRVKCRDGDVWVVPRAL